LTQYERERFLKKQMCQADITLYGKDRAMCDLAWLYPAEPSRAPPREFWESYSVEFSLGMEPLED